MSIERSAGQGRYAQVEREQRWVLPGLPGGLLEPAEILDLYLTGTRLRLRRVSTGAVVVHKFGQKVRSDVDSPELVRLTNLYLSAQEYELLRRLPGDELRKTRWRWPAGPRRVVVDEFGGPLRGLVLAEVELAPGEAPSPLPGLTAVEVTRDDRFSGGHLARLNPAKARQLLAVAATLRAESA